MKQEIYQLNEFVKSHDASRNNLTTFCRLVYDAVTCDIQRNIGKITPKLSVVNLPIKNNGMVYVAYIGNYQRFTIVINIYNILMANNCSDRMKFFYLYATILHELEHINLLDLLEQEALPPYTEMIAAWNQVYKQKGVLVDIIFDIFALNRMWEKRKLSLASPSEIHCNYMGLVQAYEALIQCLSEEEKMRVSLLIKNYELMRNNLEISYNGQGFALGLFVNTIVQMRSYFLCKKRKSHYPMLSHILDTEGKLISVAEMMRRSQCQNHSFYDEMLIHLFIFGDVDWNALFATTEGLKSQICTLANKFCKRCVHYLLNLNQEMTKVLVPKEVVQDNGAMIVKSIIIVKEKMKQYGMQDTAGGIFPMYETK